MSQRRTRYQVETSLGTRHVLAYTPETAVLAAQLAGYTVTSGAVPYRRARATGTARWTVDERAIRAACRALDVRWPVRITRTKASTTNGVHRLRVKNGRPTHYITGPALADVEKATATLWHELTHAAQAERVAREANAATAVAIAWAWDGFVRKQKRWPYSVRPIEVEARQTAEQPPLPIPLVAPA